VNGQHNRARRTESAFPDTQYAQVVVQRNDNHVMSGPISRGGSAGEGYTGVIAATTYVEVYRYDTTNGKTYLADQSASHSNATDYTTKVIATGSTIEFYTSGTLRETATDSTYSSGKPGIGGWCDTGFSPFTEPMNDFECTDASAGAAFMARQGLTVAQAITRSNFW
jgi:hypothetical protein